MWFNQTKCDIYMGTGAGKKLLHEISNAQTSVKISSPYLSVSMIQELLYLHNKGIQVSLITSCNLQHRSLKQEKCINALIKEEIHFDSHAFNKKRWTKGIDIALKVIGIIALVYGCLQYVLQNNSEYVFLIGMAITFLAVSLLFQNKAKSIKVHYSTHPIFPLRIYVTGYPYDYTNQFIHGKFYVIDNKIAYLGSLNFTDNGTKNNYETRIRITEPEAVKKINEEFDALLEDPDMEFLDIDEWAKEQYHIPL